MILLQLNNIGIKFGGLKALDNIDLSIHEEEIVSIIGPNGAGKTTLFNLITGVYQPTNGDIFFKDRLMNSMKPHERTVFGIARTFQNIRLFKQLSVIDNIVIAMHSNRSISFLASVLRLPTYFKEKKETYKKAQEYLEYIGLLDYQKEKAENLSYGKQRELEIARAIATEADLLLLDEPAAGMNPQETIQMMNFILRVKKDLKKSILLIEHDMTLVMGISDKVVVLDYGKKLVEGLPREVQNNKKVIEAYLGVEDA